ncbi:MAG TPA: MBL fold metallo-hydrolase [Gammaproteobacteria bacterium]|jgi:glyoxylase-like metal-dependent hydrolase (beta-lactamase superfamily II)
MIRFCRVLGLALVLLSSRAMAQFGTEPAVLDLVRVTDDIYVIHNDFVPGNITVLVTDDGVLLVDTKYALDYDNVAAMLAEITDQPIRYVVNTHYHDDHSGANAILQTGGARVMASGNARRKMLDTGRSEGLPNVTIEDFVSVHIGDTRVDLYYFGRAHTDGDVVAHFPDHGVLAAGDIYANDPGTPELVDYSGGGSAREWPLTLSRALELDFEQVVPGHGTVVPKADMAGFRDETARLAEMVQSMNRAGRSREDIDAMLRSEFNFADFHISSSLDGLLIELQ